MGLGNRDHFSLFTLHFSLNYPGVSEEQCFAETSEWRTQGSGIGEAAMDEGKTGDLPRSSGDEQHIAFKSGDLNERVSLFTLHFSLPYPGVSEG